MVPSLISELKYPESRLITLMLYDDTAISIVSLLFLMVHGGTGIRWIYIQTDLGTTPRTNAIHSAPLFCKCFLKSLVFLF